MKTIVAIFAALLVLVAPAVAQDPDPQGDGQDPAASDPPQGEPSSNETAASPPPDPSPTTCPLVKSYVGDPSVPKSQWVIVDPNGCLQQLIYRILTWPPTRIATGRLPP